MKNPDEAVVIIPIYNMADMTIAALNTLVSRRPVVAVVLDNGSTEEERRKVEGARVPFEIYVLRMPQNSLPGAWNAGIYFAFRRGNTKCVVINSDVLLNPSTLDTLLDDVDIWGFVTARDIQGELTRAGKPPEAILDVGRRPHSAGEAPDFSCFCLNKACYDLVGEFDEGFPAPAYFEDNDYHYRMKLCGIKAMNLGHAPYYHYGSRTQNQKVEGIVTSPMFELNRAYYVLKWGGWPGQETSKIPFSSGA